MVLQLPKGVADNIQHFTGRTWLLPHLLEWFGQSDERMFILTGEPGTGKSMVAAWLAGSGPLPTDEDNRSQLERFRAHVKAIHFNIAGSGNTAPKAFARNVATQLTASVRGFGDALAATLADLVRISSAIDAGQVAAGGSVTGIYIKELNLGKLSDELSFDRTFRDPLKRLYDDGYDEPIILLVDALDEARTYTGPIDVVRLLAKLSDLPREVRVLATTRPDPRVLKHYHNAPCLDLIQAAPPDENDVRLHTYQRLGVDGNPNRAGLAHRISEAADGNFLYAHLVLKNLLPRLPGEPNLLMAPLPKRLSGIYYEFLNRELGTDEDRWYERFGPLLGLLAVAQGDGLDRTQIEAVTGQSAEQTLRICKQYLDGNLPEGPFRLFHKSFADFLLKDEENQDYHIDAEKPHQQIIDHYWRQVAAWEDVDWNQVDDYALGHTATHLAEAALGSSMPKRHRQTERLVKLVLDTGYQQAHLKRFEDVAALQRDLEQGLTCAAADSDTQALPLLLEMALKLTAFPQDQLTLERLFDLARAGDVKTAERRLPVLAPESDWKEAIRLIFAWLASERDLNAARELRDRVAEDIPDDSSLALLVKRVNVALEGTPIPTLSLPPAPPPEVVKEIVARMGGFTRQEGHILEYGIEPVSTPDAACPDSEPVLAAQRDGPLLVAYAAENPEQGSQYFEQYASIHAANDYVQYRNRSLWALLVAALNHPDQDWVRHELADLALFSLTEGKLIFREGLPLTILALQTLAGKPGADQLFEGRSERIVADANEIIRHQWDQGQADTWGRHKRGLAALAQIYTVLFDAQARSGNLLERALDLPYGFAGFQSPACLTLAEAIHVCLPNHKDMTNRALKAAQAAAHNVQDPTFCARATARFNAMCYRWWGWGEAWGWPSDGFDVATVIEHLCQSRYDPDFAALHLVDELYQFRLSGPDKISLPSGLRNANTLAALADVYQWPLDEFVRLNRERGWATDEPLPGATTVNVPDPGFAPLLAARFAAEALVDPSLSDNKRVELIQSLVPIVVANQTALDTVLSRLLLAVRPTVVDVLTTMEETAGGIATDVG